MHSDSVMDERTLRELYLTNFEIAIKEGHPHAVMSSYNKLNGTYANENSHLYDILRKEWGFKGIVVTDWGGCNSYVEGIRAGMNLEMPAAGPDSALQLMDALKNGIISKDLIDERIDTLLDLVLTTTSCPKAPAPDIKMQHTRVREAAGKCVVLLKNSNNILPLNKNAKIAVIGDFAKMPRYQGAGSSMVNPQIVDNTLSLLSQYFPNAIGYAQGFERMDKENPSLEAESADLVKAADAVLLYIGLPEGFETEGLDRSHMRLPANQIHLIHKLAQINPHIIAVLSCGSAVEMPWIEDCESLLYGGLGGEAGAEAMLRILCGETVPGGKLAETFPISYDSCPVSKYYPGTEATSEYREGIYVGYRYYTTAAQPVRFPFGFGLSYTTFSYQNLSVSDTGVRFTITNTGSRDADEIAQMYISLPGSKIFRPALELKGFARISLKAGECREVTIPFDTYTFRYFNVLTNAFETESGVYRIRIGASCEDIRLEADWTAFGSNVPNPYTDPIFDCYRTAELTDIPDSVFEALLGRTLPAHTWERTAPLEFNDTFRQLSYAKNPLARIFCRILNKKVYTAAEKGTPNLNLLFIRDIPFRGISKMMGGMITSDMAEDILFMANGHGFRGAGRLIRHFLHKPRIDTGTSEEKKTANQ